MIPVTWQLFVMDPVQGHEVSKDARSEVPRVPSKGDFVTDRYATRWEVIAVIWPESMDRATVQMREVVE